MGDTSHTESHDTTRPGILTVTKNVENTTDFRCRTLYLHKRQEQRLREGLPGAGQPWKMLLRLRRQSSVAPSTDVSEWQVRPTPRRPPDRPVPRALLADPGEGPALQLACLGSVASVRALPDRDALPAPRRRLYTSRAQATEPESAVPPPSCCSRGDGPLGGPGSASPHRSAHPRWILDVIPNRGRMGLFVAKTAPPVRLQ